MPQESLKSTLNPKRKPQLLVLTSTFPRWPDDHEPPFVFELARRLTTCFEVTVLAPHMSGAKRQEVIDGVAVERFRYAPDFFECLAYEGGIPTKLRTKPWLVGLVPLFLFAQAIATIRLLRHLRPQAIHAHWLLPQGLIALMAIKLSGTKARVVVTAHGADIHGLNSRFALWLKKHVVAGADAITVVSQAMGDHARALNTDSSKIQVIPMGVDLRSRFVPGPSRPRGQTLIFAGRLVEKKGVSTLLEAMSRLVRDAPNSRLLIAGFGPLLITLKAQAHGLGISDHVKFLGSFRNEDLPGLLRSADIAVYPFRRAEGGDQEGLGLVVIEAMGCGLPVVVGDQPAVHDLVVDGETGLLVASQNPAELSQALLRVIYDNELAEHLAQKGHAFALANFDWEPIADSYAKLLMPNQ